MTEKKDESVRLLENLKKDRQNIINKNEKEFHETTKRIKKEIETFIAPKVMEDLQDNIRAYFEQYR